MRALRTRLCTRPDCLHHGRLHRTAPRDPGGAQRRHRDCPRRRLSPVPAAPAPAAALSRETFHLAYPNLSLSYLPTLMARDPRLLRRGGSRRRRAPDACQRRPGRARRRRDRLHGIRRLQHQDGPAGRPDQDHPALRAGAGDESGRPAPVPYARVAPRQDRRRGRRRGQRRSGGPPDPEALRPGAPT